MTIKSGVYQIVNIETNERYIGSTKNFNSRKAHHLYELRKRKHRTKKLQCAYNEYGEDVFAFLILEYVQTNRERRVEREQYWMDLLHPEYNEVLIARCSIPRSARTKEAKKKISISMKKRWQDPEYRANYSKARKGKTSNRKGVKLSEETKEKIRQANLGENNPNYGKPKSQAFLDKMVKTYKGAISPEGDIYSPIIGLSAFCRVFGLDTGQMSRVLNGKANSHKGWTKI